MTPRREFNLLAPLSVFTLLWLSTHGAPVTLYGPNDHVVELVDANITSSIYNSDSLWVVEFYAHWCGHCIRFSPIWKELAEIFKDWKGPVMIGAMNCAEQTSCNRFNIRGTPTLRVFLPKTDRKSLGIDMNVAYADQLTNSVLSNVALAQKSGLLNQLPDVTDFVPSSFEDITDEVTENLPRMTAFILDAPDPERVAPRLGARVALQMGKLLPNNVIIRLVPNGPSQEHFKSFFQGPMVLPALLIMSESENMNELFLPDATESEKIEKQMVNFINSFAMKESDSGVEMINKPSTSFDTTEDPNLWELVTISAPENEPGDVTLYETEDKVYATDLEKAIEYALMNEIKSKPVLNHNHLSIIYLFLEVITNYVPVRKDIKDFLVSLREWPIIMGYRSIRRKDYFRKVKELSRVYRPFDGTPEEWKGCKGSQPHLRGFPCSLWTLFHTAITNAALQGDPGMMRGGSSTVARAMTGYIHHFFSCRHCAENFAKKVQFFGNLPTNPKYSVLWLWQIHNMANAKLMDDPTEDPEHPKIIWPSPENCPECRQVDSFGPQAVFNSSIQGELWNTNKVIDYLVKVYRKENIDPNNAVMTDRVKGKRINELKSLMTEAVEQLDDEVQSREFGLTSENLAKINDYCSKLFNKM